METLSDELTHSIGVKKAVTDGRLRVQHLVHIGEFEAALNTAFLLLQAGKKYQKGKGVLIDGLIALAINNIAIEQIYIIIQSVNVLAEMYRQMINDTRQYPFDQSPEFEVKKEKSSSQIQLVMF